MAAKLYIVVRQDLPPAQRMVQACHAVAEFSALYPEVSDWWFHRSNHIAVLGARDYAHLRDVARAAIEKRLHIAFVNEPDIGNQLTAIALTPGEASRPVVKRLRLATVT